MSLLGSPFPQHLHGPLSVPSPTSFPVFAFLLLSLMRPVDIVYSSVFTGIQKIISPHGSDISLSLIHI